MKAKINHYRIFTVSLERVEGRKKDKDKGAGEKGSERRTYRGVGSNLSERNCQFECAAWG